MKKKTSISAPIERFYNKASEENRLSRGMGIFEFERTKSLIERLIERPSIIVDVGGGTGKYSEWLSKLNHQVYLVEPIDKHLNRARERSKKLKNKFKVLKGEARNLDFPNNFADVVILHGPLYHLQKEEDRILTINEAKRVVKKGGLILGFGINSTATTLVGLLNGLIFNRGFFEICKSELLTGIHQPSDDFPWLLAEAFYHRPLDFKKEFMQCDLNVRHLYAVEGLTWLDNNFFSNIVDERKKAVLTELLSLTEDMEFLLPFSPHMMIVATK